MEQSKKLICTGNAFIKGKMVKAGTVDSYPEKVAKDLLASKRFALHKETAKDAAPAATVDELKAELDGLGIEYKGKATKAELLEMLAAAQAED